MGPKQTYKLSNSKGNYKQDEKTIYGQRESESRSVMPYSLRPHGLYSPRNSPGQNTGVDSGSLLQGIFPIQGLNPGLPHCRRILYHLSHQGSLGNVLMSVIYLDGIKK